MFCVLPFGLSTAPYIFTKVTRVLVRHWRAAGIRCQMYMDDGSGGHCTKDGAKQVAEQMRNDLICAGFVPNESKCQWEPSQVVEMLGMRVDLRKGIIYATERRVEKLRVCLNRLQSTSTPTARDMAQLTGYLLSMSLALGPVSRLRTRAFYAMILSRYSWSKPMLWSEEAWQDLKFWSMAFESCHGQPFWKKSPKASVLSWSDASDSGWGGFCVVNGEKMVAKGEWPDEESQMSSTWRELRAVALVIESLTGVLQGVSCIHRSDNQAAVHIIQVGSRKPHLQREAMRIHQNCMQLGIRLSAEWVPREENELADYYSKLVDTDDWQLNPSIFEAIDQLWGPHTLDCFASLRTRQLERFCSRWWNPECYAIDAFTVDWSKERVWLVPPFYLISRVLSMLTECRSHGTLVIPRWVSAEWWPKLHGGTGWRWFVKSVVSVPYGKDSFLAGSCPYNLLGGKDYSCEVLALKVCMREGECC